ncbi:MAG: Trk system potassium transporter TrkA [Chlamydiia bacterium]|nr:Trk system potassium transporter TrkA [Chlamydiia bacterium]
MHIVILGAGDIGQYVAQILSKQENNVILVDKDARTLEKAGRDLDVATRVGSGTDWQLLESLLEWKPELILAFTDDDEKNLVACSMAKHLGYQRAAARIRDKRYLIKSRLDFGRVFHVDHFIGPELSVAKDLLRYIINPGSKMMESFVHGSVTMRTLEIPVTWQRSHLTLRELELPPGVMIGLIRRGQGNEQRILFPHGQDRLLPHDEVTFIGESDQIARFHEYIGLRIRPVESVVILGGSLTAANLASDLCHHGVGVRLIESDTELCYALADQLPEATIINHDVTDLKFLLSEKIDQADMLVACTSEDTTNLLAGVLAKEAGCENVVAMISQAKYLPVVKRMGINHVVSPRQSAASRVLCIAHDDKVTSMVSLYENQAEIMEIKVSMDSKVVGIPISELGPQLPKDFLLAVIQNRGRIMIANGDRILSPGDTVIVISNPVHAAEFDKIF